MHHIPYRGAGPAINDVLGGQVPVYFDQVNSSLPHIKAGKVRAMAVSWHERLDVLPDVQTYAEAGHPDLNNPSWFGLVAPKSTPAAQVERVQKAMVAALKDPAVQKRMSPRVCTPRVRPRRFHQADPSEVAKMKKVAVDAKIQID
jgi:tripartite-type tricarboxylate transporter receptor subunit TctC